MPTVKIEKKTTVIAVVGRPNVGKSSLFNAITNSRTALVSDWPGLTRDVRRSEFMWNDREFTLIDTGGIFGDKADSFHEQIETMATVAMNEADCLWFVVDGRLGANPIDRDIYERVSRIGKPLMVVINKIDNELRQFQAAEFYALGTEKMFTVSAVHRLGLDDLLQSTSELVEPHEVLSENSSSIKVALMGFPNSGKSSLANRLLGYERMIASPTAGTTREAIETSFMHRGQSYTIVDTIGIRRKSKTHQRIEKVGIIHSINALHTSTIGVLVLDCSRPISEQDAKIAGYILRASRGIVIACNKFDLLSGKPKAIKNFRADLKRRLHFLEHAPCVEISAHSGYGVGKLLRTINKIHRLFAIELKTADVNRVIQYAGSSTNQPIKMLYGTQVGSSPPKIAIYASQAKIPSHYNQYMRNQFRTHFKLQGVPIKIDWRSKKS